MYICWKTYFVDMRLITAGVRKKFDENETGNTKIRSGEIWEHPQNSLTVV